MKQHEESTNRSRAEIAGLRDRTDEIELIISSLTVVVLFTLPGWIFDRFAESYQQLSGSLMTSGSMAVILLSGLSYALGSGFLLHLLTRAYWVGLIGLRSVFPAGIDWRRTPGLGPLMRERLRGSLPDLQAAIDRSDRLASSLFAVISVIALSIVWVLVMVIAAAFLGGVIGSRFGAPDFGVTVASITVVAVAVGSSSLLWFCDAQLARRFPALQRNRAFLALVATLARFNGWLFPQRLVLPVQLTIQSNTRPFAAAAMFIAIVFAIVLAGEFAFERASNFTVSDQFTFLGEADLEGTAFLSGHYEDMRDDRDRLQARPTIPSFEQSGTHLRLFLPYQPRRDNRHLEARCTGEVPASGAACLRTMWRATLSERPIDLSGFLPAERLDLGLRGLIGAVQLDDLSPGIHVLEVIWNPPTNAASETGEADDEPIRHAIPFLFAPEYEAGARSPDPAPHLPTDADETDDGAMEQGDEPAPTETEPGSPESDAAQPEG